MKKTAKQRLIEKTDLSGSCWVWIGYRMKRNGYGVMYYKDKYTLAHRIAYEEFVGSVENKHVLHTCDTPWCINPDHLFLGNNSDNQRDKFEKGRQLKGADVGTSKLTEDDVLFIKTWRQIGFKQKDIAKTFGVSRENIKQIALKKTWRHV